MVTAPIRRLMAPFLAVVLLVPLLAAVSAEEPSGGAAAGKSLGLRLPVRFQFAGYANDVRNRARWQLGIGQIQGSGQIERGGGVSGGSFSITYPTYYPTVTMRLRFLSGGLEEMPDGWRLTLRAEVTANTARRGSCTNGHQFTVILDDRDGPLSNGQTADFIETTPDSTPLAPDGFVNCRTFHQGWSNADNPNTDPANEGGPGGGNWADVVIGGPRRATFQAVGFATGGSDAETDCDPVKRAGYGAKHGVRVLCFFYHFSGMRDGRDWRFVWYHGTEVFFDFGTHDWTYGKNGRSYWVNTYFINHGPLDKGPWRVVIYVDGVVVLIGTFEIV